MGQSRGGGQAPGIHVQGPFPPGERGVAHLKAGTQGAREASRLGLRGKNRASVLGQASATSGPCVSCLTAGKPLKIKLAVEFPPGRKQRKHNPSPERTLVLLSTSEKSGGCGVPGCLLTQALCDGVSRGLLGGLHLRTQGPLMGGC